MRKKRFFAYCFLLVVVCSMILSITPFFVEEASALDWCKSRFPWPCPFPGYPTPPWRLVLETGCCCIDDLHEQVCDDGS
jgi:hypothetical protein